MGARGNCGIAMVKADSLPGQGGANAGSGRVAAAVNRFVKR